VNTFAMPAGVTPRPIQASIEDGAIVIDLPAKSVTVLGVSQ
jgi:HSP20 family molecular chaperone IbpA